MGGREEPVGTRVSAVTQQPGFKNLHVGSGEKLWPPEIQEEISGEETGRTSASILNSLSDKRLRAFP